MTNDSGQRVSEETRRLAACIEKMSACFTLEQLEQFAELASMMQDLAVLRKCEQSLTVLFNDRGLPRYFNGTNNVPAVKPTA